MRDAFLKQLEELHKMLAEMGLLCEKMIDGTYEALMHMDREQAAKILQDDANVDLKERDIESKCLKLLLEQQPVASDLRKISSALKTSSVSPSSTSHTTRRRLLPCLTPSLL